MLCMVPCGFVFDPSSSLLHLPSCPGTRLLSSHLSMSLFSLPRVCRDFLASSFHAGSLGLLHRSHAHCFSALQHLVQEIRGAAIFWDFHPGRERKSPLFSWVPTGILGFCSSPNHYSELDLGGRACSPFSFTHWGQTLTFNSLQPPSLVNVYLGWECVFLCFCDAYLTILSSRAFWLLHCVLSCHSWDISPLRQHVGHPECSVNGINIMEAFLRMEERYRWINILKCYFLSLNVTLVQHIRNFSLQLQGRGVFYGDQLLENSMDFWERKMGSFILKCCNFNIPCLVPPCPLPSHLLLPVGWAALLWNPVMAEVHWHRKQQTHVQSVVTNELGNLGASLAGSGLLFHGIQEKDSYNNYPLVLWCDSVGRAVSTPYKCEYTKN